MTSLGRPFEVESKRKGISLHLLAKELDLTFYSSRSVRGEWNEKERVDVIEAWSIQGREILYFGSLAFSEALTLY